MTEFEELVVAVIEDLLPGEVVSYGWVAGEAGRPGAARAVGRILRDIADEPTPWWRVVRSDGRIVSPNAVKQREMLQNEGVVLDGDRVVHPRVQSPRRSGE